ncbi:MAG: hypothetical protein IJO05_01595 [Oscillospiraceae bacterium]|nr:hypothetical protein [Oscillospiraceae bacterium]MBQ7098402.1 hypothetical protein [Oscillospiraceae bacterium]
MGHTVVLGFDIESNLLLRKLFAPFEVNKIPYGRKCDRAAANKVMEYHMTLYHWPKTMDTDCLSRLNGFQSTPCKIQVNGIRIMQAEENSWLLYFEVSPTDTFTQLKLRFEEYTGFCVSGFYHITLAVGKEYNEIAELRDYICKNQAFPFELSADRIDLYKIWSPTQKIMSL